MRSARLAHFEEIAESVMLECVENFRLCVFFFQFPKAEGPQAGRRPNPQKVRPRRVDHKVLAFEGGSPKGGTPKISSFSLVPPNFPNFVLSLGSSRGNVAAVEGHRPLTARDWASRGLYCETPAASEGGPAEGDPAEGGPGKGTQKSTGPTP